MHLLQQMGLILGSTCKIREDSIHTVPCWFRDRWMHFWCLLTTTMCYHTTFVWNRCFLRLCEWKYWKEIEKRLQKKERCCERKIKKQTNINTLQGKTYCVSCMSHLTRPSCWGRRWTRKHHKRLLCEEEGRRKKKGEMWNGQNKTTRTTTINNWQFKTYCYTWSSH